MKKARINALIIGIVLLVAIAAASVILYNYLDKNTNKEPLPSETPAPTATEPAVATPEAESRTIPEVKVTGGEYPVEYDLSTEIIEIGSLSSATEEIVTFGNIESSDAPELPAFYSKLTLIGINDPVYGYLNSDGNMVLRTYGTRYIKINNVNKELLVGYFPIEVIKSQTGRISIRGTDPARPVEDSADTAAVPERENITPDIELDTDKYHEIAPNLFECIDRKGHVEYRTFGRVGDRVFLFDCTRSGDIRPGSLPVEYKEDEKNIQPYIEDFDGATGSYTYPTLYNKSKIVFTVNKP